MQSRCNAKAAKCLICKLLNDPVLIVSTPILHLFAGIRKGQEPMVVQAFCPEAAVERLDEGVVGRFARA